MIIEHGGDEMKTVNRPGASRGARWTREGASPIMCYEVEYHMQRLLLEAENERLAGPREGLRQHVGHALMALGRAIHGLEPQRSGRPAAHLR